MLTNVCKYQDKAKGNDSYFDRGIYNIYGRDKRRECLKT